MSELTVTDLRKSFRGVQALEGMTFGVSANQVTGIIGPNGSGKTTLFNVITGFMRPDSGDVHWEGKRITRLSPHRIARKGLVRTFQHRTAFPDLTVREMGLRGHHRRAEVDRALRLLMLEDFADKTASSLSFGATRLVGIACLLPLRPKLMLLDEPAAGLSGQEAVELAAALRTIIEDGHAVCVVDHSMEFMTDFCDVIIAMDAGVLLTQGTPEEVMQDSAVEVAYLGHSIG
jgi:branched-chain amino acid transport system ATP-binding protein